MKYYLIPIIDKDILLDGESLKDILCLCQKMN